MKNLILVGGIFHDFHDSALALADVLKPLGLESRIENDIEAGLASLNQNPVALLTINALCWEMIGDKYDSYRADWAMRLSPAGRAAIISHLHDGGALLGLHTASICFSDWHQWGDILGGSWQWGRSWHPPQEFVSLTPSRHPLMEGIAVFDVFDELYSALELRAGIETLLIGNSTGSDVSQPVLWLNRFGNGRIVYDALGHDAAAVYQTDHAHALRRAVCWALNLEDVNV
tara:strand:+ start:75 stop:764 length:690 start_codon:yes stop_codon:yes gene_type:complete